MHAHLEAAILEGAYLERATLRGAHLEGAILIHAVGLSNAQLAAAFGDAKTHLPEVMLRPAHWAAPQA